MSQHQASRKAQNLNFPAAGPSAGDAISALSGIGVVCRFDRGEALFSVGDIARDAFQLISGTVRLYHLMADGRRQIIRFSLAGEFLALDEGTTHSLFAEAIGDVIAIRYNRERLSKFSDESSAVCRTFFENLRQDLFAAQNHLLLLGRQVPRERVAHFLLDIAARDRKCRPLELPMGRQDIADYLGLTIETVSRVFAELKRAGHITIPSRHGIELRDIPALRAIAEGTACIA
jgi:CRP-like cAMP-binding protein